MTTGGRRYGLERRAGAALVAALLLVVSAGGSAQEPAARVDSLMARFDRDDSPGAVVAVVRAGELVFAKGYGQANLEYGSGNRPDTRYHMASVSKQFTAFAIALLESRGALSVDDPVRRYLPEVPDFGVPITIRQLLHHTSGLRDQWTLWALAGGRLDDVITEADLLELVRRQRELNFPPGSAHLYSNTGYMLLSEIVERVSGEPYREWMRREVFEPLGMHDTQVYDDHERIVPGRAYSYAAAAGGAFRKSVLSYANQGATSLFSTAADLAKWLGNFGSARLGGRAVLERMQERGVLSRGDTIPYAFGIVIDRYRGLRRIAHSGGDAGFRTMLLYFPDLDAGVITLSNFAGFPGNTALQVAEAFFGEHMEPVAVQAAPPPAADSSAHEVAPVLLTAYAGSYRLGSGQVVTIVRDGARLSLSVESASPIRLRAISDSVFELVGVTGQVTFHREPDGTVKRATARVNGEVALSRFEPWRPVAAELAVYAGRYYSPELETSYTLAVEEGRLVARHRRHGSIPLEPAAVDEFRAGQWFMSSIRFERDQRDAITGFRAGSDRVRNLRFELLQE